MKPNESGPLVTILIATRDRPEELRRTLRALRTQDYENLELIVIDDGSTADIGGVVRADWPEARFVRCEVSAGQSQRRSEGFELAEGDFILQLDDDSAPVGSTSLKSAVAALSAKADVGALSFQIYNGEQLPAHLPAAKPRYAASFVGCGVFFRSIAVRAAGGYCPFFGNEWEEEELGLRLLKRDWAIYFFPTVLIHHRLSASNRKTERTWMRGFRNKLWAQIMHYPVHRLAIESPRVICIAVWDAVRLFRPQYLALGIAQFVMGLPRAIRLRDPMSAQCLSRYDALRFRHVIEESEYQSPPRLNWGDVRQWYRSWRNRPRQRSVWDRRPGDTGGTDTVVFAHDYNQKSPNETPLRETPLR